MNTTNMEKFSWESGKPGACFDRREPGEISIRRDFPQRLFASCAGKPPDPSCQLRSQEMQKDEEE